MKIKINTKEKKLNLWVPTAMLHNRLILKLVLKKACEQCPSVDEKQLKIAVERLHRAIKDFKGLVLVDVVTKDEETVKIIL